MKKMALGFGLGYLLLTVLFLPAAVTYIYGRDIPVEAVEAIQPQIGGGQFIQVVNPGTEEILRTEFEDYIIGVVAAEMPATFHEEALKAQAVAARTYAIRHLEKEALTAEGGALIGQAYISVDEMKNRWGLSFQENYNKIASAVWATRNQVIVYEDEPIEAVFHSTSGGVTENAENVWEVALPYLVSVESVGDVDAPGYISQSIYEISEAVRLLQEALPDLVVTEGSLAAQMQVIERSEAGYVSSMQIGNKIVSGRDIRTIFGLRSSNFTVQEKDGQIIFQTRGYGHGVGMSQYGANAMAEQGYTYNEILRHYYQDIQIVNYEFHE